MWWCGGSNWWLEQAYINHFPKITIKRHEKFIDKPSAELLESIECTKSTFKKFKKLEKQRDKGGCEQCSSCSKCVKCKDAWDRYKSERNNRTNLARDCKRNNVLNDLKAKSVKNDLKGIWKTIKLASNINPSISYDGVGNESKIRNHLISILQL